MAALHNLSTRLADRLPQNLSIRAYHLSTPPTKTSPIFSAAPGQPEETTFCESHFLALSAPLIDDSDRDIFIFAIEVLIFTTSALTTVFVSKADSTGYSSLVKLPDGHPSITRSAVEAFIDFLLEPRLTEPRVVLSLFARSQDQYLFAGSVENAEKHVLDDRQLIKWWCRVLDSVWRPHCGDSAEQHLSAHVVVPGTEKGETKAFFPPSSRNDAADTPRWINGYPVKHLTVDDTVPPRCLIPRLPDDPKSRFLGDLDRDHIGDDGQWRSVKTLDQFWEFMSYRQECSAGRLVGFIWVTFVRPSKLQDQNTVASEASQNPTLPTPEDSQQRLLENDTPIPPTGLEEIVVSQSPPPSSPPSVNQDQPSTDQPPAVGEIVIATSRPVDVRWPPSTRGQIVCDLDTYDELTETLLRLDFAGQDLAAESTQKWTTIVKNKTETQDFGVSILGMAATKPIEPTVPAVGSLTQQPTMLTGVRKKRKPDGDSSQEQGQPALSTANLLSTGLVRKKPKTENAI